MTGQKRISTLSVVVVALMIVLGAGWYRPSATISTTASPPTEKMAQAPPSAPPSPAPFVKLAGSLPPCSNDSSVTVENLEAFNWSYCDIDLRPFWKTLGIPTGAFKRSESLFQVSSSFGDFDGDAVDEHVLNIQQMGVCRIVVLKRSAQGQWISIGFLDIPTFHLSPEARIVTNGRGRWLAVSHHTEVAWGTGIFQEDESWYGFDRGKLSEVLNFPAAAELAGPLQFAWKTNANPKPFDGAVDRIDIEYTVTVGTSLGDGIGGDFRHTVSYRKQTSAVKFSFDSDVSQMKESEFRALHDLGNLTWKHWANLVRLAAKNDPSFDNMFDRVLTACRNADETFWNCRQIAEEIKR